MNKRDRYLIYLYLLGLAALLVLRDIFGVGINKFIILFYFILLALPSSYEALITMLCFTFPLICGLPGTYMMLSALIFLVVKRRSINARQFLGILFLLLMELSASIWYIKTDIAEIIKYLSYAAVVFMIISDSNLQVDYIGCIKSYVLGTLLLSIIIVISTIQKAPSDCSQLFSKGWYRFGAIQAEGVEEVIVRLNPNSMAFYSIIGICCCFVLIGRINKLERIINIGALFIFALIGILSTSRTWILVLLVIMGIYIVSIAKNRKKVVISLVCFLTFIIFVKIVLHNFPEIGYGLLERLVSGSTRTGGGRIHLFMTYFYSFFNSGYILFGTGVTQYRMMLNMSESVHNGLQQIVICYGVVGAIIFLYFLVHPLLEAIRKVKLLFWLPFIGMFLFMQTIQFINPVMHIMPYVITVFSLRLDQKTTFAI